MNLNPKKFEIPSKDTYKLEAMLFAAKACGNPERGRRTILVAGTNGKGSTCHYLTQLFMRTGLKVGTYTSPHIMDRCERIRIHGKMVSELLLKKYEKKYARVLSPLSYFERLTLLAFLIFRDSKVDLQILEVGIGGRLDATNISDPDLSLITRIDFDHQDVLGKTLPKITGEKAGIMRSEKPSFISSQLPLALKILQSHAKFLNAALVLGFQHKFSPVTERLLKNILKTRGIHQEQNARLSLSAFQYAADNWGLKLSPVQIEKALNEKLPLARIQILREKPLFIVDGSHNENSIDALVGYLKTHYSKTKFTILFGVMDDKPSVQMLKKIRPYTNKIFFPTFYPERQLPAAKLTKSQDAQVPNLKSFVLGLWRQKDPVLVVGSLYLAGTILSILKKKGSVKAK